MGLFIPKTYLKWREPNLSRQSREALEMQDLPLWVRPVLVLLMSGIFLLSWFVATLNPQNNPPPFMEAFPLALIGGAFVTYLQPLFYRLCPSYVLMREKYIYQVVGDHPKVWRYSEIQACRIVSEGIERGINLLEITTKGKTWCLGIAPTVSLDQLQRLLMERGVSVCRVDLPLNDASPKPC